MAARRTIRTVLTQATSRDLTTLANVKEDLGLVDSSQDARLNRYIAEASLAAEQFCNRVFAVEEIRDEIWPTRDALPFVVPGGEEPLTLSTWPLVAVSSVLEDGVPLVADTDYRIDRQKGQLIRMDGNAYPRRWPACALSVTYTAGYAPIPADVAGKIVRMVTARYYSAGRDPALMSESIPGVRDYRVWVPTGSDAGNMPPDVVDVLNNYRVPVLG